MIPPSPMTCPPPPDADGWYGPQRVDQVLQDVHPGAAELGMEAPWSGEDQTSDTPAGYVVSRKAADIATSADEALGELSGYCPENREKVIADCTY